MNRIEYHGHPSPKPKLTEVSYGTIFCFPGSGDGNWYMKLDQDIAGNVKIVALKTGLTYNQQFNKVIRPMDKGERICLIAGEG